jgi:hypothetical protein
MGVESIRSTNGRWKEKEEMVRQGQNGVDPTTSLRSAAILSISHRCELGKRMIRRTPR